MFFKRVPGWKSNNVEGSSPDFETSRKKMKNSIEMEVFYEKIGLILWR